MNEKILEALAALADKLGTTAEYLWGVMVKQAAIGRAESVIMLTLFIVGMILFLCYVKKGDWDDLDFKAIVTMISAGIWVISLVVILVNTTLYLSAWFNPEGYALLKIFGAAE